MSFKSYMSVPKLFEMEVIECRDKWLVSRLFILNYLPIVLRDLFINDTLELTLLLNFVISVSFS